MSKYFDRKDYMYVDSGNPYKLQIAFSSKDQESLVRPEMLEQYRKDLAFWKSIIPQYKV
jgi:hypothetical protein